MAVLTKYLISTKDEKENKESKEQGEVKETKELKGTQEIPELLMSGNIKITNSLLKHWWSKEGFEALERFVSFLLEQQTKTNHNLAYSKDLSKLIVFFTYLKVFIAASRDEGKKPENYKAADTCSEMDDILYYWNNMNAEIRGLLPENYVTPTKLSLPKNLNMRGHTCYKNIFISNYMLSHWWTKVGRESLKQLIETLELSYPAVAFSPNFSTGFLTDLFLEMKFFKEVDKFIEKAKAIGKQASNFDTSYKQCAEMDDLLLYWEKKAKIDNLFPSPSYYTPVNAAGEPIPLIATNNFTPSYNQATSEEIEEFIRLFNGNRLG